MKKYNIFFFQESAYPTGAHIGGSLDSNRLQRDKLWKLIDRSSGSIAFCAHEHNYTRLHIDQSFNESVNGQGFKFNNVVYQVTTGTFGAPIYSRYTTTKNVDVPPVLACHFAVVDITVTQMKITVYNSVVNIIDSFQKNAFNFKKEHL